MHPCFYINELLENIVEQTVEPESFGGSKDMVHLCNIALTCRTFYEPAMNRRWGKMSNLTPLLLCLPEQVVQEEDIGHEHEVIRAENPYMYDDDDMYLPSPCYQLVR